MLRIARTMGTSIATLLLTDVGVERRNHLKPSELWHRFRVQNERIVIRQHVTVLLQGSVHRHIDIYVIRGVDGYAIAILAFELLTCCFKYRNEKRVGCIHTKDLPSANITL